jgi:hypothetical protein
MEEEVKNSYLKKIYIIFAITLFLGSLYMFIAYTFFVEDKYVPEDENAFLYTVSQINPITLIFGEKSDDEIQYTKIETRGLGEICSKNDECLICLECVDETNTQDSVPKCMPIANKIQDIEGGCKYPNFCNGKGTCVECIEDSDCKDETRPICNTRTGTCLNNCLESNNCLGRECGDDGCGGVCGTCLRNQVCNIAGTCVELRNTTDKEEIYNNEDGTKKITPSELQLLSIQGYQGKEIIKNDMIDLKNLGMGENIIRILDIIKDNNNTYHIIMNVSSEKENSLLYVDEIKKYDLNQDKTYDIEIYFKSATDDNIELSVKANQDTITSLELSENKPVLSGENPEIENKFWDLSEKPETSINLLFIIFGVIATIILFVLLFFLIMLFVKIKRVASGNKDIDYSPELKPIIEKHESDINELLAEGYKYLNKNDSGSAREVYQKIRKIFNPIYDPNKKIYNRIGEFYKRIIKLEI